MQQCFKLRSAAEVRKVRNKGVNMEGVNLVESVSTVQQVVDTAMMRAINDENVSMPADPPVASIPFHRICLTGDESANLALVANGALATDGPMTTRCIAALQSRLGLRQAIMTPSCTSALEAAIRIMGIGPGDEVVMPSFTFCSTANAVLLAGAVPVFIDVRHDTLTIDEDLIEAALTPRTCAICVVHYAGIASDLDRIIALAARRGIPVIEDAAQAVGSFYRGRPLGGIGDLGTYSFHHTKNITAGEGGALCINNPAYEERAYLFRDKGTNRRQFFSGQVSKYTWISLGSSTVMSEAAAAMLAPQLENLKRINENRGVLYKAYLEQLAPLANAGWLGLPLIPDFMRSNYHFFRIMLPTPQIRAQLMDFLKARGIQAATHFVPLHSAPMGIVHCRTPAPLPVTEWAADHLLRLPLYTNMSDADQGRVVQAVIAFFKSVASGAANQHRFQNGET
jgi:dTDP-4-amino-4,6-dideoxygalactose transaminase